ncbi:MAG TPA: FAD-dependent oxidoreductase [Lachnospiraceae bacterium]|nr:FAD-dependent oxidoreductase [Lachnospiraceae bacterium]
MLFTALELANRSADYDNLLELLGPSKEITTIAPAGSFKGVKVGIIGGGIAGLTAAFELRKLGYAISIFESETKRIGGRVYTNYFNEDRTIYGELGAMRFPISHEATWHYINLFGLQTTPYVQRNPNTITYVRHKRVRNDPQGANIMREIYPEFDLTESEKTTPVSKMVADALSSNLLKLSPDMRKELLQVKQRYSEPIENYGNHSIREMLALSGLSEGAIELISCVNPFVGALYNNSFSENLSGDYAMNFLNLYRIIGGSTLLPLAFHNSLLSKAPKEYSNLNVNDLGTVTYEQGKTVIGIYNTNRNGQIMLEYRDEETSERDYRTFDYIICAIPLSRLRIVSTYPMFSPPKMQAIKEVFYIAAQKTVFLCKERFWEMGDADTRICGGSSSTDLPIETIWYPTYKTYDDLGILLATYNLNQDSIRIGNLDEQSRIAEIKRQVEAVNGLPADYLDSIVVDYKTASWNSMSNFLGGFCYFLPEQLRLFTYEMSKPEFNSKVYFAGEHTSLTHGWVQGAISSAMNAANSIARHSADNIIR